MERISQRTRALALDAAIRRLEEQDPTAADVATAGGRVRFAGRETMRSERLPFTSTVHKAALLVILSVGVVVGAAAIDDPYVFATIDPPGATWAEAYGINAVGDIVGVYGDAAGQHGFLLERDEFASIDYPGANLTSAFGINPGGEIVGVYRLPGEPASRRHGYLLTKEGVFVPIDVPGHLNTIPTRILPDGTIVGCYHDGNSTTTMYGFVMNAEGLSEFSESGTMHYGATPDGQTVVGRYINNSTTQPFYGHWGYVADGSEFTRFRFPGSAFTQAFDINPVREIVGWYRLGPIGSTDIHGFLMRDWVFTTLDYPGGIQTWAVGINPGGDVVGGYYGTDRLGGHAFLASRTGWGR